MYGIPALLVEEEEGDTLFHVGLNENVVVSFLVLSQFTDFSLLTFKEKDAHFVVEGFVPLLPKREGIHFEALLPIFLHFIALAVDNVIPIF